MADNESKAESQGQESQITTGNLERFRQCVTEIDNLIEQVDIKPNIYSCKKTILKKLVTDLSRLYEELADQHVDSNKEGSKNTKNFTTPIKTQHVGSSTSTSPQIGQTSKTPGFITPSGYHFNLHNTGGFDMTTSECSETSFTLSSDSESTNKHLNSPVNDEVASLKKKIQDLTDENALLKAEKANVADLKLEVSESNRKIETMGKAIEASIQQIITANLNAHIKQLETSRAAEEDKLKSDVERLKTELSKKCELVDELKATTVKLEREVETAWEGCSLI